jgi:uncharacterized caspase-like protein
MLQHRERGWAMLRRLGLGLLLWMGLVTAALAEKRVALILAVEDYQFVRPLDNPANDARAMEDLLEKLDFEVFVETNRDLRRMRRALEDFQADAEGADVALLFFAGHGVALDGVNFLLPTDANAASAETLAASALPLAEAQAALQAVADVVIVILDACRDNPFAGGGTDGRGAAALDDAPPTPALAGASPGLGRIGRADGVLFAFAAAPNETASDGDGANSPFTEALVRHLGTAGVELRTALTLVQQDVYDRSRGKQLPYIESGLPELVFITGEGALPERDQLLIAMADLTPELRAEVETLAAERNLPLAPLYAAVLSADLGAQTPQERGRLLMEAALSYESFQTELQRFSSDDPKVAELRAQADEQLTLGAFDTARALLTEAAEIDASARNTIRETYLSRTVSEAATHLLNANAARTDLRYDLAISDLGKAVALYAEIVDQDIDRETRIAYVDALIDLGELQLVAGNTRAALEAFTTRSKYAQAQVEGDPTDLFWVRELIWSLNSVGNVLQQQGYLKEAETAYASALEFSQWQADQMPDNVDLIRDRQVARNKLGEIRFARNDFAGAHAAHTEALALVDQLMAIDPASPTYRRDLSFTQERLGDALLAMGDKTGAKTAFDVSLRVTEELAAEFPNDEGIRRDLSVSYERIGDTLIADNDFEAGLASYGKALEIREVLAANDPGNMLRQRDLSVTFERIGDINGRMGDDVLAMLAYQAVLTVRTRLAGLDPTNMLWQRDLSVTYERLGNAQLRQNDFVAALASFEEVRRLRAQIVELDPENLPRQRDLGVAYEKLGEVKAALGDKAGAAAIYQEALTLRRSIAAADPTVLQYKRDLSFSLMRQAEGHLAEGNHGAAEPLLLEAITLRTEVVGAAPEDIPDLRDLSISQNVLSAAYLTIERPADAMAVAEQTLQTVSRILQIAPEVPDHTHDLLVTTNRLGDAQMALGDAAAATLSFAKMVEAGSALLDVDPYNTGWVNDLALALDRLGNAKATTEDFAGALKSYQEGLALRDWLVQRDTTNTIWARNLALNHANVADILAKTGDAQGALDQQEASIAIFRYLVAQFPDDSGYKIDLVQALDYKAFLLADPRSTNEEALAILEGMQAAGTLPPENVEWISAFRRVLGLPTEF